MKTYDWAPFFLMIFGAFMLLVFAIPDPPRAAAQPIPVVVVYGADDSALYRPNYDVATLTLPDGSQLRAAFPSAGEAPSPEAETRSWYIDTPQGRISAACSDGLYFTPSSPTATTPTRCIFKRVIADGIAWPCGCNS